MEFLFIAFNAGRSAGFSVMSRETETQGDELLESELYSVFLKCAEASRAAVGGGIRY